MVEKKPIITVEGGDGTEGVELGIVFGIDEIGVTLISTFCLA